MQTDQTSFQVPYRNELTDERGFLSNRWELFFRQLQALIFPLGSEQAFPIRNNQVTPLSIQGMALKSDKVSQAIVEYLIQRVTQGTNPVELIQSGSFLLVYKPTSETWNLVTQGTPGPDNAGVTFSVNSNGEVQYTSTQVDGSESISKISFRIRTLAGKSKKYSTFGQ